MKIDPEKKIREIVIFFKECRSKYVCSSSTTETFSFQEFEE